MRAEIGIVYAYAINRRMPVYDRRSRTVGEQFEVAVGKFTPQSVQKRCDEKHVSQEVKTYYEDSVEY